MSTFNFTLLGDINLIGVEDTTEPFAPAIAKLQKEQALVANLECCLFDVGEKRELMRDDQSGYEGLYAPSKNGQYLKTLGLDVIGNANNQNYGAPAILASNAALDGLGIAHAGTGIHKKAARAPVIIEREGVKIGFIQRTSQYWPNNHEAGEKSAGVATMKAYTAYQPPYFKDNNIPPNRPGAPAKVVTWVDADYLAELKSDIAALKQKVDIVISSHHWGYAEEILQYQKQLAHAAIDAGADVVMGHGPHFPLGVEFYQGKPIFYGLGMFCFIRSNKRAHRGWTGMAAHLSFEDKKLSKTSFSLVRQNDEGKVRFSDLQEESTALERVAKLCEPLGTQCHIDNDRVRLTHV